MTAIDIDSLVGNSFTKEYVPELAYNRVIVCDTSGTTPVYGVSTMAETPAMEKLISVNGVPGGVSCTTYAAAYLANMREGWQRYQLSLKGIDVRLYQTIDLSALQFALGITDTETVYRVSDVSYSVGETGSTSTLTLVSEDYEVLDAATRKSSGDSTLPLLLDDIAAYQAEIAKARIGSVSSTGSGTVTIAYKEGDTKTITDFGTV